MISELYRANAYRKNTHAINISHDGGNTRQSSTTTGNDANVFIGVLTFLSLTVGFIVKVCNGLAQFYTLWFSDVI